MTRDAGFTLVELLVTVAVLALLSVVLFAALRFGVRAWDGSEAHGTGMDELRVVQNLLRREIEQIYPAYLATDPVHPRVDFGGGEGAMDFLAPPPQAMLSAGRARIRLAGERDGRRVALVMHAQPELAAGNTGAWSEPLLRNLAAVRFSYYGAAAPGGQPVWQARWPVGTTIPQLVRLHVDFARGDSRVWPDLIVAPRIEADAGCVYDDATQACQGRR